jgi:uncharacterized protein YcgI (DUF1989 family)
VKPSSSRCRWRPGEDGNDPDEHYSLTNTIQAQGALYLGVGSRLMSSEGRPMLTITADACGRHDTLGGACSCESNTMRYALEKRPMHNAATASWRRSWPTSA